MASIRRPSRRSLALVVSTICALVALFGLTANAGAITRSGGTGTDPWIASELPDYAPGSTVNLLGGSWQPGESVHVNVNDNDGQTWARNVDVTADSNGNIADTFSLPNWFIATYSVTATGATGSVATTSFTDGNLSSVSGTVTDSITHAAISGATLTCSTTSGCNNTFTTTTDASGAYSFTGGNKLSFAGNGPATLTLSVSKAGYATGTITLGNVSNGDTLTGRNIALVPSGPTKLAFSTSAVTGAVGDCLGPITVQTQNATGTATDVTSNASVNLATDAGGTGAGAFYDNSGCSTAITSTTIAAGSNSASFYYSATGRGGGSHQVAASATGLTSASQTETITKANQAALSVTSPASMTYGDPDATIAVSGGSGTGTVTFDAGTSSACSIVSGKLHVVSGTGTCSITATKAGDGNFNPTTSAPHGVSVSRRELIVSAHGLDKVYDGTSDAEVTLTTDALAGDDVTAHYSSASFATKHVGTAKDVGVAGIAITGDDAANYDLQNTTAATSASIGKRPITVTAVSDTKIYDGTTSSDETPTVGPGSIAPGDTGGFGQAYLSKTVGTGKTLVASGSVADGNGGDNYDVTFADDTSGVISTRDLTVAAHGIDKGYDGNASATVTLTTDALAGDTLAASYADASFADKHAGSDKPVSVSGISISGADAANYHLLNTSASTTANISRRPITISAVTDSKIYDGTTSSDETPATSSGTIASGDSPAFSQAYASKTVGTGKTLVPSGSVLDGNGGNDYAVTFVNDTTGVITAKSLAIEGAVADDKVYDGNASATVDFSGASLTGVVSGDSVSIDHSDYAAGFGNKNVGQDKPVTVNGVALGGGDAGNYTVSQPSGLTADITTRDLTVSATGLDRQYDGTTAATVNLSTDKLSGDTVDAAYTSASFANKHAGGNKPVSVSGISISGADASNYHLTNTTASATADISRRPITISAVTDTKVYDGTTGSNKTPTISSGSLAPGDTAAFGEAFATKTVGAGKTLTPFGSVADGNSGNNYAVTFVNDTTGVITAKALTVAGITASNKPWDGNTSATINATGASLVGVVAGDTLALSTAAASGAFTSANVGTCNVQISGLAISGADSGNYSLTQPVVTACISAWHATGFYAPVGVGNSQFVASGGVAPTISPVSTMWNAAKGGSTIPLKFNLYTSQGGAERTNVGDVVGFTALKLTCTTGEGLDEVDFVTTGSTTLRYDGTGGQFIQNWKTPSASTDQCYRVNVTFLDGSSIYAFFKLRR